MRRELIFMGTGTSYGVPMVGCRCSVCTSSDPRNVRTRCSALIHGRDGAVLIDPTPDFRSQALREGLDRLDAVLITHVHADHVLGLDDLRPLSLSRDEPLPVFAADEAAAELRQIFGYVFETDRRRPGVPWLKLMPLEAGQPFAVAGETFLPFPLVHGRCGTLGFRFADAAWVTDVKRFTLEAWDALRGVRCLALDMLREEPHPTHLCLADSLDAVRRLGDPATWFIHMGHEVDHGTLAARLPEGVRLAVDGLRLDLETLQEYPPRVDPRAGCR